MNLPDPVTLAIPGFVALLLFELWLYRQRAAQPAVQAAAGYRSRDTMVSLALGLGSTVAGVLTGGLVLAMAWWVWQFRLVEIGYGWWAWPLCFVADDLAYYCFHRAAHRVRWFWAAHVIHHSSQHYNLSTALRQTWTGFFALGFLFRMPLFLIGFPPPMVLFCAGLNLVYQFWFHTELIDRMPRWFEAVMNTPSHHRVHHATNARYLDANYAGVFIIWDRMFGSFVAEQHLPDDPIRYGLVRQLGNQKLLWHNLLWAAFHEWIAIARDLWSAPWGSKLGYMIKPPGWSHDGSRETSQAIRARWDAAMQQGRAEAPMDATGSPSDPG